MMRWSKMLGREDHDLLGCRIDHAIEEVAEKPSWERRIYMGTDSTGPEAVRRHRPTNSA
jgi:hypothetical protein